MELYFLRHGTATDKKPGESDEKRELTTQGMEEARTVGNVFKNLGVNFNSILASPLIRARQTATIVAEMLGFAGKIVETSALSPGSSFQILRKELENHVKTGQVLLVGHQPTIGRMIVEAWSGQSANWIELEKAGLALVNFDSASAEPLRLKWLLTQAHFALMSKP